MTQQEAGADMRKLSQTPDPPHVRRPLIVAASLLPTARALSYDAVADEPLPDAKAINRQRAALERAMHTGGRQ